MTSPQHYALHQLNTARDTKGRIGKPQWRTAWEIFSQYKTLEVLERLGFAEKRQIGHWPDPDRCNYAFRITQKGYMELIAIDYERSREDA